MWTKLTASNVRFHDDVLPAEQHKWLAAIKQDPTVPQLDLTTTAPESKEPGPAAAADTHGLAETTSAGVEETLGHSDQLQPAEFCRLIEGFLADQQRGAAVSPQLLNLARYMQSLLDRQDSPALEYHCMEMVISDLVVSRHDLQMAFRQSKKDSAPERKTSTKPQRRRGGLANTLNAPPAGKSPAETTTVDATGPNLPATSDSKSMQADQFSALRTAVWQIQVSRKGFVRVS